MKMRRRCGAWTAILLLIEFVVAGASNEITTALQKGLFEEEANQNLPAAIEAYQTVIQKLDENRKLAATAVFRLGECYRKLGKTNEAAAQYQRVLREFNDQTLLVTLSEQNLGGLLPGEPGRLPASTNQEPVFSLEGAEIKRLQAMIKDSPDLINAPGTSEQTPLQTAAHRGQLQVAEFLLQQGADPNLRTRTDGNTALHLAAQTGHKAMVGLLLNSKAEVNGRNNAGKTALHLAAGRGFKAVAELLLRGGAEVNARDDAGETPLHEATKNGQLALVELLLANKAQVNASTTRGVTALTKAVKARHLSLVKFLLENKADPNASVSGSKQPSVQSSYPTPTRNLRIPGVPVPGSSVSMRINYWQEENYPVHLAVKLNDSAILRLLLAAGADPNRPVYGSYDQLQSINMDGWTPLIIAIEDDRQEMVELLLSHKANPDLSYEGQPKPLFRALSHPEIAELLLQHGADVKVTLADGSTPLHKAVESGQKKLVQALLQRKAEVNAKDQNGLAPLHLAVGKNDPELVEMLLAAGADATGGTPQGDTALHFAVGHQNSKNVELLLAAKADVNARNSQRQTPLGMISPVAPNAPAATVEIAALLRRHGGLDDLPRDDQIEIRRGSANYSNVVFVKGTNELNRFTLLEALAVQYGLIAQAPSSGPRAHGTLQMSIPSIPFPATPYSSSGSRWPLGFPDFQKLKVLYPRPAGFLESTADVRFPDCSGDPTLPWGTVIEVPEADHPLNATWQGLPSDFVTKLQECLQREVTLTVKGQTTNLVLRPRTNGPPSNFYLRPVLMDSGLIRTSSDLSRVKVKRQEGAAGGVYELTFDCSESAPSPSPQFPGNVSPPPSPQLPRYASPFPDLWLRDGDIIEVPEKP